MASSETPIGTEYLDQVQASLDSTMPWIGMYIAAASAVCTLAMAADAFSGFRSKKYWLPCKYFSLNAFSLTLLAVAMKLPVDLTNLEKTINDNLARISSLVLMSTAMSNFMTSLGGMENNEILLNMAALGIPVITIAGNVCIHLVQMRGFPYVLYVLLPQQATYVAFMLFFLVMLCCMSLMVAGATPPDVAKDIRQRGELIVALRRNLEKAQNRMRASANRHRRHVEFAVSDRVLLKLQQYRQHSVARPISAKLARRFYGPFEVLERIGPVAYRLKLPEGSRIHDVFHVSLLRQFVEGSPRETADFPVVFARGHAIARPICLLDRRVVWCDGSTREEGQLQWSDDGGAAPTWEPMTLIEKHFPDLLLVDKEPLKEGGVDTEITPTTSTATLVNAGELERGRDEDAPEASAPMFATEEEDQRPREGRRISERTRRRPVKYGDYVAR